MIEKETINISMACGLWLQKVAADDNRKTETFLLQMNPGREGTRKPDYLLEQEGYTKELREAVSIALVKGCTDKQEKTVSA
jgi:hypothetical protein